MAGQENLIPLNRRTEEEQRAIQRKGGKASGESRKRKRTIKEGLEILLSLPLKDEKARAKMEDMGINPDDIDNEMAMNLALMRKAMMGDVTAFNSLRDTIGERPKEVMTLEGEGITSMKVKFVDKSGTNTKKEKDPKICGDYTPPSNFKET